MFNINYKGSNLKISFAYDEPFKNMRITACLLTNEWGTVIKYVDTKCSEKDHFNKNKGRKIALAHMLANLDMTKGERTKVWEEYFKVRHGKYE